jgi:hypothetical protein
VDVVTVYPEPGNFPAVARGLLEAADHPRDVSYVSSPQAGFIVPLEVFERFEAAAPSLDEQAPQQAQAEQPPKRRPGRTRKALLTPEELQAAIAAGTSSDTQPGEEK